METYFGTVFYRGFVVFFLPYLAKHHSEDDHAEVQKNH